MSVDETPIGEGVAASAHAEVASSPERDDRRGALASAKHWVGYGWFMSFGTFLPLVVFLFNYFLHLTLVGEPLAKVGDRFGIWLSTLGQEPPGKDKLDARSSDPEKKSFADRVRPYSPPGFIERRGRPVPLWFRIIWFVLVGWWLGAIWLLLSWSILLAPYPFPETVKAFLDDLPSVMTLAYPHSAVAATGA
jgi:uncharacterized membrane protein YccF (DUF307 family)